MADEADLAQKHEEAAWQQFLRQRRQRLQGLMTRVAWDCVDCGAEIPAARLAAVPGARRCIGCQTRAEQ